jgi:hypothetical protein
MDGPCCLFPRQMQMRLDENCKVICKLDSLSKQQAKEVQERVDAESRIPWRAPARAPPPTRPAAAPRRRRRHRVAALSSRRLRRAAGSPLTQHPRARSILDNLPSAMVRMREENGQSFKTYERGYPVGFKAATEARAPRLGGLSAAAAAADAPPRPRTGARRSTSSTTMRASPSCITRIWRPIWRASWASRLSLRA